MCRLTHVTFTGVDEFTDIAGLIEISRRYPFVEFGILVGGESGEKKDWFADVPALLKELDKSGTRLSAHICGSLAREIVRSGEFGDYRKECGFRSDLFKRCQLNVAGVENVKPARFLYLPFSIEEVIVQQTAREVRSGNSLYGHFANYNPRCTLVVDCCADGRFSGVDLPRVGYGLGITVENVFDTLMDISVCPQVREFWIDLGAGVRSDGRFDLEKVAAVCGIVERDFLRKKMS